MASSDYGISDIDGPALAAIMSVENRLEAGQDPAPPPLPSSTRTATTFKQPFLESFFPPQASSAEINEADAPPSTSRKRGKKGRKQSGRGKASTTPSVDEENMQTAFMLRDRSLEIYVTLPSAEKRLFVDVQEEVSIPNAQSTAKDDSSHRSKRLKVDNKTSDPKVPLSSGQSASAPASAASSSKAASGPASLLSSSKANSQGKESASKHVLAPLSAKDPNASTSQAKESKSSGVATLKVPSDATPAEANHALTPSTKTTRQKSVPRLPYPTFDQVKLNVRVKPTSSSNKEKSKQGSGITVAALPKKTVQPKVIDRFPIHILGSTTRPTADAGLQDSFDLSVQGCTDISSLLVLLYTRLKMAHPGTFYLLELNAIRLWHLDEDRLVRLSIGSIASNNITPKSILCYTVGKRTGKSFVHVYVDKSKVGRVEVDVELCSLWQAKEKDEDVEKSIPHNAPRRQLFKFKRDIPGASAKSGNRDKAPHSTSFSLSLLGEANNSTTPMDIARDQARNEHYESIAAKERMREEREKTRLRLVEATRKNLRKSKKGSVTPGNESLAANGLAVVHAIPEGDTAQQDVEMISNNATGRSPDDVSEDSDWCSEAFEDEWYNSNDRPDDDCDYGIPFDPHSDNICMSDSVLLSTAARSPLATLPNGVQAVSASVQISGIRDGLEYILTTLGIPSSARESFIRDMAQTTSVFPYIAVKLVDYETLACAMNVEAKYKPLEEEGVYWDIQDIQQVCLVYKGIWKSEVEDWKIGCKTLFGMNWSKLALGGSTAESHFTAVPSNCAALSASGVTTTAAPAPASAAVAASGSGLATPPVEATADANTNGQTPAPASNPALSPEERFTEYRKRTKHRRNRFCPNCDSPDCNLGRHVVSGCECGECEGDDDGEGDEFFKYYEEHDGSSAGTSPASSGACSAESTTSSESTAPKETVASVMVPGHRARVVQCIYMEAF